MLLSDLKGRSFMESKANWLKCTVSKGMLPGEWSIQSKTADDNVFSLFAPAKYVVISKEKNGVNEGYLQVYVLDETEAYSLISLPTPSFEVSSVIKVPKSELRQSL